MPLALVLALLAALGGAARAADEPRRPILVTVDDLPMGAGRLHDTAQERARITGELLAALEAHHARAVAFVIAGYAASDDDKALLARWRAAGHELGNHTFSHPDLTRTDATAYIADAEKGRAGMAAFLGGAPGVPRFFRYPYLHQGDTADKLHAVRRYLAASAQQNLPVTIDTQDWSYEHRYVAARRAGDATAVAAVLDEYLTALKLEVRRAEDEGDALFKRAVPQVLLVHANEVGAAGWDRLFAWLEATGHRFATADEVLSDPAFATPEELVAPSGMSLWARIRTEREIARAEREVREMLAQQAEAWTRGDIDAFVSVYADDAVFLAPTGVTRGRDAVATRYHERYPDRAAMGALRFEVLEVRPVWGIEVTMLGDAVPGAVHAVSVAARWTLDRAGKDPASGLTLLALRRTAKGWRIEQDASM